MKKSKKKIEWGTWVFVGTVILAAILAYINLDVIGYLILALLGAVIAIQNIMAKERTSFILATAALVIFILGLFVAVPLQEPLKEFLNNLIISFGVAGFVVALGEIVKLGSTR